MARRGDGICQRGRMAFMLAVLSSILGVAASASAACAWIAWASTAGPGIPDKPPFPIESFADLGECKRRPSVSTQELTSLLKGAGM